MGVHGCLHKLGILFVGVLIMTASQSAGVHIKEVDL